MALNSTCYLCAGENQKLLAFMEYNEVCYIVDIDTGTVVSRFSTDYYMNDGRVYLDDQKGVLYTAGYSTRLLNMYDVYTGIHFNSIRTSRRIDTFIRVSENQLSAESDTSIVSGDIRTGQLKRKFRGIQPMGPCAHYPPFVFMRDLIEKPAWVKPFLVDANLDRIGRVIDANYRGAAYLCEGKGLAWTYEAGTTFHELDFIHGTTREIFRIDQEAEWTLAMFDENRQTISIISINRQVDIIHVDVDMETYSPIVRRTKLRILPESRYVKRLHRLYQHDGLVYDIAAAEYLDPIILK